MNYTRRSFVKTAIKAGAALAIGPQSGLTAETPLKIDILNPRNRVPVSLIIDDQWNNGDLAMLGPRTI